MRDRMPLYWSHCGTTRARQGHGLLAMNALLEHRGPDDEGIYIDPGCGVGIAARRLAIIDLVTGAQPMSVEREGRDILVGIELL